MYECKHGTILYGKCMQCERENTAEVSESTETAGYGWIKEKEGLPTESERSVEVKCADGFQCIAWINGDGDWNMDLPFDMDFILKNVTHWKELTPPPE